MAKVFFEDKFYEAPEGSTSMKFCANCTIPHTSCDGCPWIFVDMSQAVEITGIKKEECVNYVAPAQGGRFYFSRRLMDSLGGNVRNSLVFCEGTDVDGYRKIAISFDDYAAGFNINIDSLKNKECSNCWYQENCIEDKEYSNISRFAHCIYMSYHTSITYNNVHFDKEIPKSVWDSCISIAREFNNVAYDMIIKNAKVLNSSSEWDKGMFLFNDDKRFPYHNIVDNIYYTDSHVAKQSLSPEYYIETINFNAYSQYGKNANIKTQLHSNEKPCLYVIPENIIDDIIILQKEMDNKITNLINDYVK